MTKTALITILFLLFSACSKPQDEELVLSTNSWIGYTPLFYAQEKGYLKKLNIKLITSVSLAESANIFLVSKADILTLTQHEYNFLKKEMHNISPVILLDRSNGGDMILSNKTLQELKLSKNIDVYLEIDSINKELIEEFTESAMLNINAMHFINKNQAQIQNLQATDSDTIIVTYAPNNIPLEKHSFSTLASTADINSLLVIDALLTKKETLQLHKERFEELKRVIDLSIQEIQNDPKTAHKLTKKYLNELSYDEFNDALKTIEWINKPSEDLLKKIEKIGYKKEDLIL